MKLIRLLLVSGLGLMASATGVLAHGTNIEVSRGQIQIHATYDGGDPMQNAQVLIYSPENLEEPWMKGTTDENGQFAFTPDPGQPGTWEVTVRQAGHGGVATIPMGDAEVAASQSNMEMQEASLSPVQQWVTIGAVIWGFVGTALFFSRGKR